ncbi:MAG: hypothetical protein CVV32_06340 [Methanomicrobiales archaeon HGW-Methanomicrobiales-3]|nr:MAG: hypothetical protein CVV32_06340 [Methanomicrobiales archaeon HGW-Methanomicrobiales-3]
MIHLENFHETLDPNEWPLQRNKPGMQPFMDGEPERSVGTRSGKQAFLPTASLIYGQTRLFDV